MNYELWAKKYGDFEYKKLTEFSEKEHIYFMLDVAINTGEYQDAIIVRDNRYVLSKKTPKPKVMTKNV